MINWWNVLPAWVQKGLSYVPSPVLEAVSGVLTFALGWGCAWLCWRSRWWVGGTSQPLHSSLGLIVSLFFAHVLSATYEAVLDPNGWEWPDLLQREVGLVASAVGWWYWL